MEKSRYSLHRLLTDSLRADTSCGSNVHSRSRGTVISSLRPKPVSAASPSGAGLAARRCCCRGQEAQFTLNGFAGRAVAFVACFVADALAWFMAEMRAHFGLYGSLENGFGKLFDQAGFAKQVFWCGLLEELVDEFWVDGGGFGHVVFIVGLSG
jgi:hypothetical protein